MAEVATQVGESKSGEISGLFTAKAGNDAGFDSRTGLPRILLVDDEPSVLSGLQRLLRSHFSITTAEGGRAGLDAANEATEPFAVIITDMRMPEINGVALLKELRSLYPDTIRILLTGFTDLDSAIAAVNEGNVFRFLTKPCAADQLHQAIKAGVEQYRLIMAERELLEGTLRGAVGALIETLSLANPAAFSRAVRIRGIASNILDVLDTDNRWEIEVSAMLAQLGAVTLTPAVADKLHRGQKLSEPEQAQVARLPEISAGLLVKVPRLDGVRELIGALNTWQKPGTPLGTRIIQLATVVESNESQGAGLDEIIARVKVFSQDYGDDLINALHSLHDGSSAAPLVALSIGELRAGMKLAADIQTTDGMLLVGRGQVVTESLLLRLENFTQNGSLAQKEFLIAAPAE